MTSSNSNNSWFRLPRNDRAQDQIANEIEQSINRRISAGEFTTDTLKSVADASPALIKGELDLTDLQLEKLRRLCQLWDVDLRGADITSHRPVVGWVIVAFKKTLHRFLRVLMRDVLRQQRAFNAATITFCAELSQRKP